MNREEWIARCAAALNDLLACPFCGSTRLRIDKNMFADDDGEHPGVECLDCDAANRLAYWNNRKPAWIDGSIAPAPGQLVILYYRDANGKEVGPMTTTPIHADGSHIYKGRYIYAPTIRWLPCPLWEG